MDRTADRQGHVSRLVGGLEQARDAAVDARDEIPEPYRADGFAVRIEAAAGHALKLESLDSSGLTLMSVHPGTDQRPEDALVWVPYEKVGGLSRRIKQFTEDTDGGAPKQAQLVANMEKVQRALFEHLWQEDDPLPSLEEHRWWELWFDPQIVESDPVSTLRELASEHQWPVTEVALAVGERLVAHVHASGEDLRALMGTNATPVEIRRPTFAQELHAVDRSLQHELVDNLADRVEAAPPDAPAVCVLDTGVNQEHPLLKTSLHGRAHSALPHRTAADRHGHGTEMAGIALYGDLAGPLESSEPVVLTHGLESVKILDGVTGDPAHPRTYAEVTANAVATAEIEALSAGPPRARVFSMAVTDQSRDGRNGVDGTPTLWSAALDALAAGTDVVAHDDRIELLGAPDPDASRLIVVSAGNIRGLEPRHIRTPEGRLDHLTMCDLSRIEEPAQAHNILAVGAFTELTGVPEDASFAGFRPLAESGQLSPFSRTSVALTGTPVVKPDIVMEGGNLLVDPGETLLTPHDVVSVTTTGKDFFRKLSSANATSSATAQAARLAALAHAAYPSLSPEAVRGLLVHEARWTPAMMGNGLYTKSGRPRLAKKELMKQVIRRYGWGVPSAERVLSSAANAVTLIVQSQLIPFQRTSSGGVSLAELEFHELPWPLEQLRELGAATVALRVTLSYFVEPNPGRLGLRGRYSYASHRLRFAIRAPGESADGFERRITAQAEAESDTPSHAKAFEGDKNWLVGPQGRNQGSLHTDVWQGSAAELADCGVLAVHPSGAGGRTTTAPTGWAAPYATRSWYRWRRRKSRLTCTPRSQTSSTSRSSAHRRRATRSTRACRYRRRSAGSRCVSVPVSSSRPTPRKIIHGSSGHVWAVGGYGPDCGQSRDGGRTELDKRLDDLANAGSVSAESRSTRVSASRRPGAQLSDPPPTPRVPAAGTPAAGQSVLKVLPGRTGCTHRETRSNAPSTTLRRMSPAPRAGDTPRAGTFLGHTGDVGSPSPATRSFPSRKPNTRNPEERALSGRLRSAFEDEGEALADADAEGGHADAAAPAGELVGEGAGEAGAGDAMGVPPLERSREWGRVAEGDGAALRVEDRRVELGPLGDTAEDLGGEGLFLIEAEPGSFTRPDA